MIRLAVGFLVLGCGLGAQPVSAPVAQGLIDALLRKHPEVQTIGLHVTPPGLPDNVNIAGSKPGKVGKRSAEIDVAVIATGKPSMRRAAKGAYDMGLPISDSAGRALGMVVIILPLGEAADEASALRKAGAVRDELAGAIPSREALFVGGLAVDCGLAMIQSTALAAKGEVGELVVDRASKRVWVGEAFDLEGEHVSGYDVETKRFYAIDGDGIAVRDGTGKEVCRFPARGPRRLVFVPELRRLYSAHPAVGIYPAELQVYEAKR